MRGVGVFFSGATWREMNRNKRRVRLYDLQQIRLYDLLVLYIHVMICNDAGNGLRLFGRFCSPLIVCQRPAATVRCLPVTSGQ